MTRLLALASLVVAGAALALLAAAPAPVSARSSGLLSYCDLTPQQPLWPNGKFGRYNITVNGQPSYTGASSGVMIWVNAPVANPNYTLRAGDGAPSADATTYIPGETTVIHLRVQWILQKYIGLVLYATNGTDPVTGLERHVGNFSFPAGYQFQLPASCGGNTVTHTNANLKPLHTRWFFTAPKGTGRVKFRALIKQGEQNKGSFYWPAKDLYLNEGVAPAPASAGTVVGGAGQACTDVCAAQASTTGWQYCDWAAMAAVGDANTLASKLAGLPGVAPRLPFLAQCPYAGAPQIDENGYAGFVGSSVAATCPAAYVQAANVTALPDLCRTAPLQFNQAVCACTSDASKGRSARGPAPHARNAHEMQELLQADDQQQQGAKNAAPRTSSVLAVLLAVAASAASFRNAGLWVALALLLCTAASPAAAHNYIKSQHRADTAAVATPCQARVGNQPHVQVIDGQTFEIEWSGGHGDYTQGPFIFTMIAEEDYDQLRADNISDIINDYMTSAPASASIYTGSMWEKHQLRFPTDCSTDGDPTKACNDATYFSGQVATTDPAFIVREDTYISKAHPNQYNDNTTVQMRFLPTWLSADVRVAYDSPKYPWIMASHSFINPFKEHPTYNNQATIARFSIPARKGPGNYVIYFRWTGYTDCIDVNVQPGPTPIANRYGLPLSATNQATFVKMDHCEFTYIGWLESEAHRLGPTLDAKACLDECGQQTEYCTGIQVVRAQNLPNVLPFRENIPWAYYNWNATAAELNLYDPCMELSVFQRLQNGCPRVNPIFGGWYDWNYPPGQTLGPNDFICYGTAPMRNQDNQVEEIYTISSDPMDPVWYSTCFIAVPPGGFINIPPFVQSVPMWNEAGDQCVSCAFQASLASLNFSQVPDWSQALTSTCEDCDVRNNPKSMQQLQLATCDQTYCPGGEATAEDDSGSSAAPSWAWVSGNAGLTGFVFFLILLGAIGVIVLSFWGIKKFSAWREARGGSGTSLRRMAEEIGVGGTGLSSNPARQWNQL